MIMQLKLEIMLCTTTIYNCNFYSQLATAEGVEQGVSLLALHVHAAFKCEEHQWSWYSKAIFPITHMIA